MDDVTVFFRERSHMVGNPHKELEPEEILSDRDVEKLNELVICIYRIQQKSKEKRERYFDNDTILKFIDELVLMIDNISRKKNIKDYIAHPPSGPQLEISARVIYKS